MMDNCWLPQPELFEDYKNLWNDYERAIYYIFRNDFIDSCPKFLRQEVKIRREPMEYDKPEAFYHVTCKDYKKNGYRAPDFRRCERIRWIRAFIENYDCDPLLCDNCDGVKVWREPYKKSVRVHMLLEEERYIVILEKRKLYYLLITAFYIEYNHSLIKELKKYERFKNN